MRKIAGVTGAWTRDFAREGQTLYLRTTQTLILQMNPSPNLPGPTCGTQMYLWHLLNELIGMSFEKLRIILNL